jgi:SAM-dependent methyltransferase
MNVKHLPYEIDPTKNRNHYYETLWKLTALDLLKSREPDINGWSLLDYGCGRGETMQLATELGMEAHGTDMDPKCVELASAFGHAHMLDAADPVNQFGSKAFDVVACFHVLEHVPRPLETLIHLREMAKRYVLVAVPNLSRPRDFIRHRNWDTDINDGHIQSWDHSHFRKMAEKHAGLRILAWGHDTTIVPPLSNAVVKLFGNKMAIKLETGLFRRLWPFGAVSVIALMEPIAD